jgi:uncharacterized protein
MTRNAASFLNALLAAIAVASALLGCATYQGKVHESRQMLIQGQVDQAVEKLGKLAAEEGKDQLVYLLDYGVALQIAKKTNDSTKVLLRADKLAEELDYHSISKVAASALTSEEMIQYKGDTFEKIFINAYLAMNFLEQGDFDSALVESRRINQKYTKFRSDEKKAFELNPFAKYLAALSWEASGQYDDAYIDFSEAYKLSPFIATIKEDLIRTAKKARRMDDYERWKKEFPEVVEKPEWYDKGKGELIVIFQQGWGPQKAPDPAEFRFPILRPSYNYTQKARLIIGEKDSFDSRHVYDVEKAAIQTLQDDRAALVARRLGGIIAKKAAADELRRKNELLGAVAWIAMNVSDRADLRQWSLLPQSIQVIRTYLKPGKYKFKIAGLTGEGTLSGEMSQEREIVVKPGRKVFVNWRSLK